MANLSFEYERRLSRVVDVGGVKIGGDNPVSIQSMITSETRDTRSAIDEVKKIHLIGAEIIRITTPTLADAQALALIRAGLRSTYQDVPLVADVHHQGTAIAIEASKFVDKVRINPGLFVFHKESGKEEYTQNEIDEQLSEIEKSLVPVLKACRERGVAMRFGVNHGSLSDRIMTMYGNTPRGMVESVMEYLQISKAYGFSDIVISMKDSSARGMVAANRLLVQRLTEVGMDYPIHLGVTEAGKGDYAKVKSASGISPLLLDGIGDTIRVSLTDNDRTGEIETAKDILQAVGLRQTKCEIISCPSCGRTKFDLNTVTDQITAEFGHLKRKIAVMGCIVNGPGEVADADYGLFGVSREKVAIFRNDQQIAIVPREVGMQALKELIRSDGKWVDPPVVSTNGQLRVLN